MDIADKIKFIRTELLNLSQEKLAKKVDVTRLTIKNWEDGVSVPTTSHITMIAQIGNVTTDYLIIDNKLLELSVIGIDNPSYNILKLVINYYEQKNNKEI